MKSNRKKLELLDDNKQRQQRVNYMWLGAIVALLGLSCTLISSRLFNRILASQLKLTPQSETFKMWQDLPVPLEIDFYFFNWTNPEEIRNVSTKPILQELGPYRFRERKEKVNIVWNRNGTITYQQRRYWWFVEDASNGTLDDRVTTLNVVAVSAAYQIREWSYFVQRGLSLTLSSMVKDRDVHVTKTIGELLFDGYDDRIIEIGKSLPLAAGLDLPPYDKFGWFYMRNGSHDFDGLFNMETGANGIDKFGLLRSWKYENRTKYYQDTCGMVNGSAGEFFAPGLQKTSITLFSPDLCRSLTYDFEMEKHVDGVRGFKYLGGDRIMDNGTIYPENKCFCNGECSPSGVVNASTCRFGAPAFVSFPHFYNADPYYLRSVDGLTPDKDRHSFYLVLEPRTSVPLEVAARFQINILLQPHDYINLFSDVPRVYMPVIWFEQRVQIEPPMASMLRMVLWVPLCGQLFGVLVVLAGLVIVVSQLSVRHLRRKQERVANEMIRRWGGSNHGAADGHKPMRVLAIKTLGNESFETVTYGD